MFELIIKSEPGSITWDPEGLAEFVEKQIEPYDGWVLDENEMEKAKETMANLNKLKNAIEMRRKEVKKEVMRSYDEFAAQAKPIVERIDEVYDKIKAQYDASEEARKEAKRKTITEWWAKNGDKSVQFEKVFEERYLNKTCNDKTWQGSLSEKVAGFRRDLNTIINMTDTAQKDFMITDLTRTLDLGQSMANWERHLVDERRVAEIKAQQEAAEKERLARREEQARQQQAEAEKLAEIARTQAAKEIVEPTKQPSLAEKYKDVLFMRTFRVSDATFEEMDALFKYMQAVAAVKGTSFKYETLEQSQRRK